MPLVPNPTVPLVFHPHARRGQPAKLFIAGSNFGEVTGVKVKHDGHPYPAKNVRLVGNLLGFEFTPQHPPGAMAEGYASIRLDGTSDLTVSLVYGNPPTETGDFASLGVVYES